MTTLSAINTAVTLTFVPQVVAWYEAEQAQADLEEQAAALKEEAADDGTSDGDIIIFLWMKVLTGISETLRIALQRKNNNNN